MQEKYYLNLKTTMKYKVLFFENFTNLFFRFVSLQVHSPGILENLEQNFYKTGPHLAQGLTLIHQ